MKKTLKSEMAENRTIRNEMEEKETAIKLVEKKKLEEQSLNNKMESLKFLGYKSFTVPKEIPLKDREIYMRSPDAIEIMKNQRLKAIDKEIEALELQVAQLNGEDEKHYEQILNQQISNLKSKRIVIEDQFNKDITQAKNNVAAYLEYSNQIKIDGEPKIQDDDELVNYTKELRESSQSYAKELAAQYVDEKPEIKADATEATKPKRSWGKIFAGVTVALLGIAGIMALAVGAVPLAGAALVGAYAICGAGVVGGVYTATRASAENTKMEETIKEIGEGFSEATGTMKKIASPVLKGTSVLANAILLNDMKKAKTTEEAENLQKEHDDNMKLLKAYQNAVEGK